MPNCGYTFLFNENYSTKSVVFAYTIKAYADFKDASGNLMLIGGFYEDKNGNTWALCKVWNKDDVYLRSYSRKSFDINSDELTQEVIDSLELNFVKPE